MIMFYNQKHLKYTVYEIWVFESHEIDYFFVNIYIY